jgi:hypothetical protein
MDAVRWAARHGGAVGAAVGAALRFVHAFWWPAFPDQFGVADAAGFHGQDTAQDVARAATELASTVSPAARVDARVVTDGTGWALVEQAAERGSWCSAPLG